MSKFNNIKIKLRELINENFAIIWEFRFIGHLFLFGGIIRNMLIGKDSKDWDFVLLNYNGDGNIREFLNKYNLDFQTNTFGGYRFNYNDISVDFIVADDLLSVIQYNIDGLFYDVQNDTLISFGFNDCFKKGLMVEVNTCMRHPDQEKNAARKLKMETFFQNYNELNASQRSVDF